MIFFLQAEDGIRDVHVTVVQTCALPISSPSGSVLPGPAGPGPSGSGPPGPGRASSSPSGSDPGRLQGAEQMLEDGVWLHRGEHLHVRRPAPAAQDRKSVV